jgi:chemotaxis protein MotB
MKFSNIVRKIVPGYEGDGATDRELELRQLEDDFRAFRAKSRRKLEAARRKTVYLEEAAVSLNTEIERLGKENKGLEKEVEFHKIQCEALEAEKQELLDYILTHGMETVSKDSWLKTTNNFEKSRLISNKNRDDDQGDNSNWLMSYGDMMTLLLAVFIMLFALSSTDTYRFRDVTSSIAETFKGGKPLGLIRGERPLDGVRDTPGIKSSSSMPEELDYLKEELLRSFNKYDLGESLFVSVKKKGLEITLRDRITFVDGDSTLLDYPKAILSELAAVMRANPGYKVVVEGHTDDRPISNSRFPSNWELSAGRASNVVRFFVEYLGMESSRFSVAGFAENRPLADNSTVAGRTANRRVVIKLVDSRP